MTLYLYTYIPAPANVTASANIAVGQDVGTTMLRALYYITYIIPVVTENVLGTSDGSDHVTLTIPKAFLR